MTLRIPAFRFPHIKTEGIIKGYQRVFFAALLSLATATFADAQVPGFGVTGGINFATVSGISGGASRTGLIVGGFVDCPIVGPLSLRPEVLFSMKGYKESYTSFGAGPVYNKIGMNYIEVPVLAKVAVPFFPTSPVEVDIFAGPDFAYRVGVNSEITLNGQTTFTSDHISSITNKFDFDLAFGAGARIPLAMTTLGLEVRYAHGTGSVFKGATGARNGVLSVMASVEL